MLTLTSEYAIHAMLHLCRLRDQGPCLARNIAAAGDIPPKYLSRVLRDLVRAGLLCSSRGAGGGFRLARRAEEISLEEIVSPFQPSRLRTKCPFGGRECSDEDPCALHERWMEVASALTRFLRETTLAEAASESRRVGRRHPVAVAGHP